MDPSAFAGPDLVNSTFNCVVDGCASTGYCATEVGLCACQTNYLGQDCSIFAYAQTESTWIYFMFQIIFFSLVFLAILVWAIVEIGLMVKNANGNVKDINRYTLMIYSIIGFLGLVRVLYLAMYQYGYIQVIPEMVGNILLGLGVTLYLYIQFSIMYIWIDAYLHAKPQRREFITVVQKRLIFVMILTFLVQFVRDVITSLPQYIPEPSRYGYQIFYFCYLFVIGITTGVFLLYFGHKVRKQLKQFQDVDKDRKRVIRKMTSLAIMSSIAVILVTIIVVGFVIVLAVRDQNDEFTIAADFIERAVEASYCLVVLGVYRRRVLAPNSSSSHKSKTQQSSATGTVELKSDASLQNIPNVSP